MLLSLIFLVFSCYQVNAALCPPGWTFMDKNSYCYFISNKYMSLDEGIQYCSSIGGAIADVSRTSENAILTNLTSTLFASPWIGVRRNSTNGKFYNLDNSYVFSTSWATGEPNPNGGDCATFRGVSPAGLVTTQCWNIQPVVCKQQPALCPTQTNYGGLYTRSGTITSPGYPVQYYNNLNCAYTITSPVGTYITIFFDPYVVEEEYDYITVYDGNSTSAKKLGYIDSWYWRDDFESTSNALTFTFKTDYMVTMKGWAAKWTAKDASAPTIQTGNNGSMTSPNYPNNYDPYTEQYYKINVAYGMQINITIDDFKTENRFDILEIYNSSYISTSTLVASLSGSSVAPWNWLSPSNAVTLKFTSDSMIQYKGWHLWWQIQ